MCLCCSVGTGLFLASDAKARPPTQIKVMFMVTVIYRAPNEQPGLTKEFSETPQCWLGGVAMASRINTSPPP